MNKKSAILFFSVLVLLSLGALYVFGELQHGDVTNPRTNITTAPPSPWVRGGVTKLINVTVGHDGTGDLITNFTIEIDNSNYTSWSFLDVAFGAAAVNVPDGSNESLNLTNVTFDSTGVVFGNSMNDQAGGWACWNETDFLIQCVNNTADAALGSGVNLSATVVINVTGTSTGDETTALWNITGTSDSAGSDGTNKTNVTAYVDAQSPRLIEVNISDGNTTYSNSTWGTTYYLNGPLYIEALIEDAQLEDKVILGYNCNTSNGTFATVGGGYAAEEILSVTQQGVGTLDQKGYVTSSRIDCSSWNIAGTNETFAFNFLVNDTLNHEIVLNNTAEAGQDGGFWITLDDGEILPVIAKVNVTQTTATTTDGLTTISKTLDQGSGLDGSNDFLNDDTLTFDIEISGGYKPLTVMVVWNDTGADTTSLVPVIGTTTGWISTNLDISYALNATNITVGAGIGAGEDMAVGNTTTTLYQTTIDLNGNNSNNFVFWIYANNTENNYTRLSGPHRFQVDGQGPSITMTPPTDRTITPRASITYSCTESDTLSGNYKMMWKLQKPDSTTITKQTYEDVGSDGSDSVAFSEDDTSQAGTYTVTCIALDVVGNENTYVSSNSETFEVHYSTTEAGVTAGGGAGAAADLDFTTQEEITVKEKQGVITTFTLDGTTVHTIKIKTVDEIAGTVTIVIESDPVEVTLKIGETKEVDIDADGENDISVTLNGITDGATDITTKRLTPLPTEKPTEEVPPTEMPEEITPTPEAASKTWLWILIIVIIVVIGVGYWFMKRK